MQRLASGGVAERAAICQRLCWLGIVLNSEANACHAGRITRPESRVEVRVIPTDEELMIACHTLETLTIGAA
ncbi:MAG: hypothetical protein ACREFJ_11740 [Acetobacteraceae bacterium]